LGQALRDRLQSRRGDAFNDWRDLVRSRLCERPAVKLSRALTEAEEVEIAREIAAGTGDAAERVRLWQARTGKSRAAFYRRLPADAPRPARGACP
jgi:hypothetical protein